MRQFKLKSGVDVAFIPGAGKLTESSVIMGNEYSKYVPGLLVEVMPASPPVELTEAPSAPKPLTEVMPVPPVEVETSVPITSPRVEKLEETSGEEKRKPGRPKGSTKTGG